MINMFPEYQEFFNSKSDKSIHTLRSYHQNIDSFISALKIKKVKDLEKVSAGTLRTYRDSLKISNASKNTWTRVLSSFFSFMNEQEYIDFNVFDKVKYLSLTEKEKTINMPTQDEIKMIIESCENKTTKLMLNIMSRIALRRDELSKIQIKDIDADGRIIIHGKGSKIRMVKLPLDIFETIKAHIKNKRVKSEYLFSYDGHKITGDAIYIRINGFIETLNISDERKKAIAHPHSLRHRALTTTYNVTKDPYAVKNLAGHSNLAIGERYIHAESNIYDDVTENL